VKFFVRALRTAIDDQRSRRDSPEKQPTDPAPAGRNQRDAGDSTLGAFRLSLSAFAPCGPMLYDPVEKCFLKADIVTGLLAFDPFVAENFFALGQELLIKYRILD
jgi:hypothetical protein